MKIKSELSFLLFTYFILVLSNVLIVKYFGFNLFNKIIGFLFITFFLSLKGDSLQSNSKNKIFIYILVGVFSYFILNLYNYYFIILSMVIYFYMLYIIYRYEK